jgi:hypothetical protein
VYTLGSIGYGDVTPATTMERYLAVCTMLTGSYFFGFIVGSITSIVSTRNSIKNAFYKTMDELHEFMEVRCRRGAAVCCAAAVGTSSTRGRGRQAAGGSQIQLVCGVGGLQQNQASSSRLAGAQPAAGHTCCGAPMAIVLASVRIVSLEQMQRPPPSLSPATNAPPQENNLNKTLRARLRRYFHYKAMSKGSRTWHGLLAMMSPSLRAEVATQTSCQWIK